MTTVRLSLLHPDSGLRSTVPGTQYLTYEVLGRKLERASPEVSVAGSESHKGKTGFRQTDIA